MTMFERLMSRLGYSLTEDLEQHKANADFAFDKLAVVEPELEAAKDRLSFVAAENQRLLAENAYLRAKIRGHVRVIGALMDEVAERVPA